MKKSRRNIAFLVFTAITILLSVWGPEALASYQDKTVLHKIHAETVEAAGEGYRYTLNNNERLYILSKCLSMQALPESEQNALITSSSAETNYQELSGTYAFVVNHKGPSGKEITDEEIFETCNKGLETLKEMSILPEAVREVEASAYDAVLYSAIDVLEPRNNVAVWKLSLSNSQINADKENRLIDVYIDADNGKIYEFYVRTAISWDETNPDTLIAQWSEYMGLSNPSPYEPVNPLMETTPDFKKYVFEGMGEDTTVVTIGFYDGINELFLKISK